MLSQVVAKHKGDEKIGMGKMVEKWVGKSEKVGKSGPEEGRFFKKIFAALRAYIPLGRLRLQKREVKK